MEWTGVDWTGLEWSGREWSGVDSSPHQYMHLAVFCKESSGVQWSPYGLWGGQQSTVTNNDSTLTCCIAYSANNRAICHLIATHFCLTNECFPSLVSLGTNRGVMLRISSFYFCYRLIIVIVVPFLLSLLSLYVFYLFMIQISFYYCYLLQIMVMQTLIMYKR